MGYSLIFPKLLRKYGMIDWFLSCATMMFVVRWLILQGFPWWQKVKSRFKWWDFVLGWCWHYGTARIHFGTLVTLNDLYHDASLFSVVHDIDTSANDLNHDLEKICEWAFQWKMNLNPYLTKQASEIEQSIHEWTSTGLLKQPSPLNFFKRLPSTKFT